MPRIAHRREEREQRDQPEMWRAHAAQRGFRRVAESVPATQERGRAVREVWSRGGMREDASGRVGMAAGAGREPSWRLRT
jgi:hypothetical protein